LQDSRERITPSHCENGWSTKCRTKSRYEQSCAAPASGFEHSFNSGDDFVVLDQLSAASLGAVFDGFDRAGVVFEHAIHGFYYQLRGLPAGGWRVGAGFAARCPGFSERAQRGMSPRPGQGEALELMTLPFGGAKLPSKVVFQQFKVLWCQYST
jgi:hypothetical protein